MCTSALGIVPVLSASFADPAKHALTIIEHVRQHRHICAEVVYLSVRTATEDRQEALIAEGIYSGMFMHWRSREKLPGALVGDQLRIGVCRVAVEPVLGVVEGEVTMLPITPHPQTSRRTVRCMRAECGGILVPEASVCGYCMVNSNGQLQVSH